jgi:signal transduction histidine kinase
MFGKTLIIVLLLFYGLQLQAQTVEIQERIQQIEQRISSGELSEEKIFSHYEWLMYEYATMGNMEKVRTNFHRVIAFAHERKPDAVQRYYARMGSIFSYLNQKDSAMVYFDKAIQLLEGNKSWAEWTNVYELIGNHYAAYNHYEQATNAYITALEMNERDKALKIAAQNDTKQHVKTQVRIRLNIEVIRGQMLNHENVLEAFLSVKKLITENSDIDFSYEEYIIDANIADEYLYLGEYEKALPYIENSYEKVLARGDLEHLAYGLIQISTYHQYKGDYHKALGYAKEALKTAEEIEIPSTTNLALGVLARTYIYLKDWQAALYHTERQRAETDEDDYKSLEYQYSNFALIYTALGDIKKATESIGFYDKLKAKMSDEHRHNAIQNMEVKYNVQQKDMEIERNQAEISRHQTRQNIYIGSLLGAGLMLGLLVYVVWLHKRRNRELLETNATKDKFFSIISHDLKNPAIAQRDALQLLLENSNEWDTASITRYYQKLLKSANGQVELLYTLLNWAQLQTDRMSFYPTQFDLATTLKSDVALMKEMAQQKGVTLLVHIPEPTIVTGDSNMISVVVRNLLTNAIKFTSTSGEVSLTISPLSPLSDCNDTHQQYTIAVSDTGIGMNKEQIQNLFRLDIQQSRQGTAGEQGGGLGLIVCKELIQKHGRQLNIESEEGKGSRFWFVL